MKKHLKLLSGWLLILIGIIGLFLPFLQGIVMILGGLVVLSTEYVWAKQWIRWIRKRMIRKTKKHFSLKENNPS